MATKPERITEDRVHAGTNILITICPPGWPDESVIGYTWDIAVDGIVGDRRCQMSDGMRRIWHDGKGSTEADCRHQIELTLSLQPVSYCSIDVGYDVRSVGQTVTLSRSRGAYDAVAHVRWDGGEMLADLHAIARAMKKAGYTVRIDD